MIRLPNRRAAGSVLVAAGLAASMLGALALLLRADDSERTLGDRRGAPAPVDAPSIDPPRPLSGSRLAGARGSTTVPMAKTRGWTLRGEIVADWDGLHSVALMQRAESSIEDLFEESEKVWVAVESGRGRFSFEGQGRTRLRVQLDGRWRLGLERAALTIDDGSDVDIGEIRLTEVRLSGTVVTDRDRPVPDAALRVVFDDDPDSTLTFQADDDGRFTVPLGRWALSSIQITAESPSLRSSATRVLGAGTSRIQLELPALARLTVVLTFGELRSTGMRSLIRVTSLEDGTSRYLQTGVSTPSEHAFPEDEYRLEAVVRLGVNSLAGSSVARIRPPDAVVEIPLAPDAASSALVVDTQDLEGWSSSEAVRCLLVVPAGVATPVPSMPLFGPTVVVPVPRGGAGFVRVAAVLGDRVGMSQVARFEAGSHGTEVALSRWVPISSLPAPRTGDVEVVALDAGEPHGRSDLLTVEGGAPSVTSFAGPGRARAAQPVWVAIRHALLSGAGVAGREERVLVGARFASVGGARPGPR